MVIAGGGAGVDNGTDSTTSDSTSVMPVPPAPVPPPHRITVADKVKLAAFFSGIPWPLNQDMPKETSGNMDHPVIVLYLSLGLKHSQTSRYLAKWKSEYNLLGGQVRPNMTPDEIVEHIMANLSCSAFDFVVNAMKMMVEDASPADTEVEKYCKQFLSENPDWKPLLDNLILEADALGEESSHVNIFVDYFNSIVQSLAHLVPEKASCMSKAELTYCRKLQEHRYAAISSWLQLWKSNKLPSAPDSDSDSWRPAIVTIMYSIYSLFQVSHANDDKPPIEFPDKILVSEYALPVVYYSASFTLQRCKLAKSIKESKKDVYRVFADAHMLTKEDAIEAKLPTSMVEQQETHVANGFCRCSKAYFDFMKVVESVFLQNLTLAMMVAHDKGDLIIAIGDAILGSDGIRSKFDDLAEEAGIESDAQRKELFEYVINLFTGMRGRWFIKAVRGQESAQSIFSKAATRKKVANATFFLFRRQGPREQRPTLPRRKHTTKQQRTSLRMLANHRMIKLRRRWKIEMMRILRNKPRSI